MTQAEAHTTSEAAERPLPRFLCDEMLAQLGRWLRAAGYDTVIARDRTNDRALVARAIADHRVLLTRDRKLCELRDACDCVVLLPDGSIADLVAEVSNRFSVDWLARPFSRCLVCNTELRPAPPLARERLPAGVREQRDAINHCRQCDRLYWPGGHVRRMTEKLARWRAGRFA